MNYKNTNIITGRLYGIDSQLGQAQEEAVELI